MELSGERIIGAPRQRLYDALHDPVILRRAIPGCEVLNRLGDDRYEVTITVELGALRASLLGTVTIYDEDPPATYALRASAAGGLAGNASGEAYVALASIDETRTNLAFAISADLTGRLASLDRREIDGAARSLVREFFSRIEAALAPPLLVPTPAPTADATGAPLLAPEPRRPPADDLEDETAYSAATYTAAEGTGTRRGDTVLAAAPGGRTLPPTEAADGGGPDGGPGSAAARDLAIRRLETITPPARPTQDERTTTAPDPQRSEMTAWRWFLVAAGIAAIVALLTGVI